MGYNEVKRDIEAVRKEIAQAKRRLHKNKEEQQAVRNSLLATENSYQDKLRNQKRETFERFIQEKTQDTEEKIVELSNELENEKAAYEEQKQQLDNANLSDFYTNEDEILADIKTAIDVLQRHVEKSLSPRFRSELETHLDGGNIDISPEKLESLVTYFNKQSTYISKLNKENKVDSVITAVNGFCIEAPFNISEEKKTQNLQFGGLLLAAAIIFIFAAKVLFPFYFIFLAFLAFYNVVKNYKIFSAIIAQKAVKDNVDKIDEQLRKQAEEHLKDKKIQLEKDFLNKQANMESELIHLKEQLNTQRVQAEAEFQFDDDDYRKSYDTAISINTKKLDSLTAEEIDTNTKLTENYNKLKQLEDELDKMAGDIQASFLDFNKVGTDVIFNPNFIFDIQNGKPVFFVHPQKSALFIYNDIVDVIDFIRLICVQLRIKLNPFNLNISVVDLVYMGQNFLGMQPDSDSKDDSLKKLFQIVSSKDGLKDMLLDLDEELNRKMRSIRSQFSDIAAYNSFMLQSDSLTEGYEFVFYQDPDQNDVADNSLLKIINNGESLGIFMHLFIQKDKFYDFGANGRQLVDSIGRVFLLSDGKYYERAKDFVLENLIKPEV